VLHLQIYFPATAGTIRTDLRHYGHIVSTVKTKMPTLNLNKHIS